MKKNKTWFQRENLKYLIAVILGAVFLGIVWVVPIQSNAVFVNLYIDGVADGEITSFHIYSDEAYDSWYSTEGTVSEGKVTFRLDYEFFSVDDIMISNSSIARSVDRLEIESGCFLKDDYVSAFLDHNICEESDGDFFFSKDALNTISEGLNNTWYVRNSLSTLIILVMALFFSFQFCKKRFGRFKALLTHTIYSVAIVLYLYWKTKDYFDEDILLKGITVNNGTLILLLIVAFAVLLSLCIYWSEDKRKVLPLIIAIYTFCLLFGLGKMYFYNEKVARTPDEAQHMGYAAYLEAHDVLIPDLAEVPMASAVYDDNEVIRLAYIEGSTCPLMHPPLYYHSLRLVNGIVLNEDGTVDINVDRLRVFSSGFVCLALCLMFYIGYTRIRKLPLIHFLYAIICISVPMMTYVGAGVNNDSLVILTVTVTFFGLLRFVERKRSWFTYLLIAVGVSSTILTKATAGIIALVAAVIVLIESLIREKSWKTLFSRQFLGTIPIYIIPIIYYLYTYVQYGTFLPGLFTVNEEFARSTGFYVLVNDRATMGVLEYIQYYAERFMQTWSGIASHITLHKAEASWLSPMNIAVDAIWILPILAMVKFSKKRSEYSPVILPMYIATLLTVFMQLINGISGFKTRGYLGGFSSRYYVCVIVMFAFAAANFLDKVWGSLNEKEQSARIVRCGISILISIAICLYVYEDFIYFLLRFNQYIE